MNLLLPWGLLGLLSVAVLLLIYILRPNYQHKLVSSTFIWKLSLKYRKNRIPISRLRNIIILILQILLLVSLAFMMAKPVIPLFSTVSAHEKIAVIDASASMMVASGGQTRFERAAEKVKQLTQETLAYEDGYMSVIVAGTDAQFLFSRLNSENSDQAENLLDELTRDLCGYGSADIGGAAELAEEVLAVNSDAEVLFYTATEYADGGSFEIVDVSADDDWNAAILSATPVLGDSNTYSFTVNAGCYGRAQRLKISLQLSGVNGNANSTLIAERWETFADDEPEKTLEVTSADFNGTPIVSFSSLYVVIEAQDTMQNDNTFNVYGGQKQPLRVQYASSKPSNFYPNFVMTFRNTFNDYWDVQLDEVAASQAKTEGYDLYIFEYAMPETMPTDGIVWLAAPDTAPNGSGLEIGSEQTLDATSTLSPATVPHALMDGVRPETITVQRYKRVTAAIDAGYQELMFFNGDPMLFLKDEPTAKVVVTPLRIDRSNISISVAFTRLMINFYNYYFPRTVDQNSFEVGQPIQLNARGQDLRVDGAGEQFTFDSFPAEMVAEMPGDYTVTQTDMAGSPVVEQFFVHIPNAESNIARLADRLPDLFTGETSEESYNDLLLWLAAAALVLLCAEWLLHSRENL